MTDFQIAFAPLLAPSVLIVLAVIAAAIVVIGLWRRRRGSLLRALGLALLLLSLADPSLVRETRQPLKDVVAVILDRSGSQTIGDRTAQTNAARAEIARRLAQVGNLDVRYVDSSADDPNNEGTRLFSALNAALSDVPPDRIAGAIIVTDGQVEDIPKSAGALGFKAPLHVFVTGHEDERDLRIELEDAPKFGIVGKDLTITARVLDTADQGESIPVTVRRDGVEIEQLEARAGQTIKAPIRIEHAGPNVIELQIPTTPGELTDINNKAVITVDGVRDKLKVLLVSGEPNPGERTWRNLLNSDPNVDLVHFTILRPPEKQDGTPINELSLIAFPTADLFGRKIKDFDLIIFDRYSNQTVLPPVYFENIVRYVRAGGALLIGAGPDFAGPDGLFYSPLGQISPVRPDGQVITRPFFATVSDVGKKDPVTRDLAGANASPPHWSPWFRQIDAQTLRGIPVLNGAGGDPLLVLSREGKGRVAALLSDQIWLWARGYQGGGPYLDLLRRLAHWLMKEPDLEEEALRASARGSSLTIERQTLMDSVAPVTVTAPSGATQTVTLKQEKPGLWSASLPEKEYGLYRLTDGKLNALVSVGPENPREFQDVVSTTEKLRPLAEATGGSVRRIAASSAGQVALPRFVAMNESPSYDGPDYIGIKRTGASVVTGVGVSPLAIGFIGLLILIAGILASWLWESRGAESA